MPVCPKCHKLISESHYDRHLNRCGTVHKHPAQSLYVQSATPAIEGLNRGVTYGPPSRLWDRSKMKWILVGLLVVVVAAILGVIVFVQV